MKLVHTTLRRNLTSCGTYGLLLSYCRGKRKAIWFHGLAQNAWAECHVAVNHDAEGQDMVHIQVNVPNSLVKRHGKGLYYVEQDVPAEAFVKATIVRRTMEEIAL